MKTILILLDTVRKDFIYTYNKNTDVLTPNIGSLANSSCIFDNHYTGSLPCMPARRDIATGRLDFLEREWGGLEPYDTVFYKELSNNNIRTHISTDHYHYWQLGGEGFTQLYDSCDLIGGQENDCLILNDDFIGATSYNGIYCQQFEKNATSFVCDDDYPTIKTFNKAIEFIDNHKNRDFFLQIEGFDPHQPFMSPQRFMDLYDVKDSDLEEFYNCPQDGIVTDNQAQIDFIIKKYKANMSFADFGIGKLIDYLKSNDLYDECNIIFTTDHGYHLTEHGYYGKGCAHPYTEVSSIPYIHKFPYQKEKRRFNQFTQNVDIAPTLCEQYNVEFNKDIHGISYLPLINGEQYKKRKSLISGFHGKSVMYCNEEYTYFHGPKNNDNHPLFEYKCMPTTFHGLYGSKYGFLQLDYSKIEMGRFLSHTDFPVFKLPKSTPNIKQDRIENYMNNELYLKLDEKQINKVQDLALIEEVKKDLKKCMVELNSPAEQFDRLGL